MSWLTKFILSAGGYKIPQESDVGYEPDRISTEIGLHLLSFYGEEYKFISKDISEKLLIETIERLDWENEFHQVFYTVSSGITVEVGGSLNGVDGLSAAYFDLSQGLEMVAEKPPQSIVEMVDIMVSFYRGDERWLSKYAFR